MWIKVASSYLCALLILFGGASTQKKFPGKPTGPTINVDRNYEPQTCANNHCSVSFYFVCGDLKCDQLIGWGGETMWICHDNGQGNCYGAHSNADDGCSEGCDALQCLADYGCNCVIGMCYCHPGRREE